MTARATATRRRPSVRAAVAHPAVPSTLALAGLALAATAGRPTIALVAVGAGAGASLSGSV